MKRLKWGRGNSRKGIAVVRTIAVVLVAFFVFVFFFFESRVSPFMSDYTIMKGKQMMTELFSDKVSEKLDEMNLTYDKLMNISYSQSGEVQSLNTDVVSINRLKNEVTSELSEVLNDEYEYVAKIPVGSLLNSEFFSGLGWNLEFNNVVTGDVTSDFRSEFETGGVNQTIHRLYIDITGSLLIIAGGEQEPIELTVSVLVGETVLVGGVPQLMNVD